MGHWTWTGWTQRHVTLETLTDYIGPENSRCRFSNTTHWQWAEQRCHSASVTVPVSLDNGYLYHTVTHLHYCFMVVVDLLKFAIHNFSAGTAMQSALQLQHTVWCTTVSRPSGSGSDCPLIASSPQWPGPVHAAILQQAPADCGRRKVWRPHAPADVLEGRSGCGSGGAGRSLTTSRPRDMMILLSGPHLTHLSHSTMALNIGHCPQSKDWSLQQ